MDQLSKGATMNDSLLRVDRGEKRHLSRSLFDPVWLPLLGFPLSSFRLRQFFALLSISAGRGLMWQWRMRDGEKKRGLEIEKERKDRENSEMSRSATVETSGREVLKVENNEGMEKEKSLSARQSLFFKSLSNRISIFEKRAQETLSSLPPPPFMVIYYGREGRALFARGQDWNIVVE